MKLLFGLIFLGMMLTFAGCCTKKNNCAKKTHKPAASKSVKKEAPKKAEVKHHDKKVASHKAVEKKVIKK